MGIFVYCEDEKHSLHFDVLFFDAIPHIYPESIIFAVQF